MTSEQLKGVVQANVASVNMRLREMAADRPAEGQNVTQPVHRRAQALVETATSPKALCRMEAIWQPWY